MSRKIRTQRPRTLPPGLILGRMHPSVRIPVGFATPSPAEPARPSRREGSVITYPGDGHVITIAPTGAGKTAGSVICNALNHPGQLIVIDIKGEVYRATARRRREMGQRVHVLDLRDGPQECSDALNPLDLARLCGTDLGAVARSFAAEFIERSGHERERFWNDWAENLIAAGVAWQLGGMPGGEGALSRFYDLLTGGDADYNIAGLLDDKTFTHAAARSGFEGYLQLPDRETRPSVLGTVLQHLRFLDSELARRVTDTTTIDLEALVAGDPVTIYITVPPMRLSAYRVLLRTWLSGLLFLLMQRTRLPEHRTLMLCDEIGHLGHIDAFLTASTLMRGWGLTLWSFWQNVSQLEIYGPQARTLIDNAGVLQFFGARNRRMAQDFAALVGGVNPDAIMAMPAGEQMLLVDGELIEHSRTLRYYTEPMFAGLYDDGPLTAKSGR